MTETLRRAIEAGKATGGFVVSEEEQPLVRLLVVQKRSLTA